jgi:hypothetical protein
MELRIKREKREEAVYEWFVDHEGDLRVYANDVHVGSFSHRNGLFESQLVTALNKQSLPKTWGELP